MADKLDTIDPGMEELESQFQEVRRDPARNAAMFAACLPSARSLSQVLTGLSVDKSLEKFKEEYEKVYAALKKVRRPCHVAVALRGVVFR
jgi:hypothetical protein